MAELAQLTITVDSAAATRNIQKLVKSLQTATKPIQQVQKQLSTLDKTVKVMQGGFKGFGNILKGLIKLIGGGLFKVLSGVGKIAGGLVTGAFKMLGSILGSVVGLFKGLFKVVKFFGSGLIGATKEVVKFGLGLKALILSVVLTQVQKLVDAFQQITNRLRLAVDAQKDFNKVFARAYTISKQTRTGLYEVADLYTRIAMVTRKLGVSQSQLARVTQLVSKSVAISGASATTARGALIQLGQAFSIGVLRGDEFRSVQEALPGLLDQVARRLNVTRGELREMAYQGKVTSEVLLRTILESGKALDEQFKNIKPTLEQAFTVVNNAVVVFTGRVTKALQANDKLFKTITKIADFLDNVTDSTIQGIAIAIESIFGRIGEFFKALLLDMTNVSKKVKEIAVNMFPKRGLEALSVFELGVIGIHRAIMTAINGLDAFRKFVPIVLKLGSSIALGIFDQISNILLITGEYMSKVADNLQGLIGATGLTFASFFKYVKKEINQVLKDLNAMIHKVMSAPKFIQLGIAGMAKGLAGIFSDEEAAKLQEKINGIMEEIKTVPDYLGAVGNTATDHFKDLSNAITTLGGSLGKLFTVEFEKGSPAAKAVESIKDQFNEIVALQQESSKQFSEIGSNFNAAQSKLDPQTLKLIEAFGKEGKPVATEGVGEAGAFTGKTFWEQFVGSFDAAFDKKGGAELVALKFTGSFVETLGDYFSVQPGIAGLFGLGGFKDESKMAENLNSMNLYDPEKLSVGQKAAADDKGLVDIVTSVVEGFGTGDIIKMLVELVMKLDLIKKVLELVFAAILKPLNALTSFLMPILNELGGMIQAVSEGIMGLVKPLISMLRPFQGIIRLLGGFFKNILKSFSIVLRPIARLLEALLPVLDMLNPILQTIGQVLAAFMSLLGSVVDYFVSRVIGGGQETHDLLMMEQEIIEELTNNTKDLGESLEVIDDAVRSITESALNIAAPAQKLEDAKSRYLELFKAATGEGAEKEDITEFTNFARTYLKQAQDVLRSSGAYVEIYDAVLGDLEKVGEATFAGSSAVSDFNKANVELQAIGSTIRFDLKNSFTDLIDEVGNHADRIARRLRDYELAEYGGLSPGQIADMDLGRQAPGTYTSGIVALPNSTINQIVTSGSTGRGTSRSYMSAPLSSSTTPEYTFESAPGSETSSSGGQTTGLENIGEMAGALLQALIDGIVNAITGLLDIVKAFTMFLVEVIVAFITGYLNILKAFAELVGQLISNAVDAVKALAEFYKKLFQGIVNALSALAEFFKKILGAAVEAIQALIKLYETLFKGIVSAVTAFGSIISVLIRGVLSAGDALGSFFSSIFTGAGMAITSVVTSLFNVIFGTSSGGNIVQYLFDMIFSKMITFSSPIGAIPIIPGQLFGQGDKHILQVEFFKDMASGGNVSDVVTGGVAKGPSHQSGMIGTTRDGSPFLFEGGEFIINKKSADALGPDFLYAMNSYGTGGILPEGFAFNKKSNKDSDAHTFFSLAPILHATGNDFEIGPKVITNIPKDPFRTEFNFPGIGKFGPLFKRDKLGVEATVGSNFGGVAKGEIFSAKYGSVPRFFKAKAGIYTGGLGGLPDITAQLGKGDYVFADNPFVTASGNNIKKVGGIPLQFDKGLGRLPFSDTELYGHYNLNFPFDLHKSSAGFGRRRAKMPPVGGGIGYLFKMLMYLLGGPQDVNGEYTGGLLGNISRFFSKTYGPDKRQGFGFGEMLIDTLGYILGFGDYETYEDKGTGMYGKDGEEIKDKKGYFLKLQDYFDRGLGLDAQRFVRFFTDNGEDNFNIIDYFYDLTGDFFGTAGPGAMLSRDKVKNFLAAIGLNKGNTDALLEALLGLTRMKFNFGGLVPAVMPNVDLSMKTLLGNLSKSVGSLGSFRIPSPSLDNLNDIIDIFASIFFGGGNKEQRERHRRKYTPDQQLARNITLLLKGSLMRGKGGTIPSYGFGGFTLGSMLNNLNFLGDVFRRPKSGPTHIFGLYDFLTDGSIGRLYGKQSFTIPGGTRPLGDKPKSGPTPLHNLGEMLSTYNILEQLGNFFVPDYNQPSYYEDTSNDRDRDDFARHRGMGMGGGVKKYAGGGMVYGPSHAQGGVLAELEGGEYVLPKYQVGAMVTGQSGYQARTQSSGAGGSSDILSLLGGGGDSSGLISAITDLIETIAGEGGFISAMVESDSVMKNFLMGVTNAEGEVEGGFVPTVTNLVDALTKEDGLIPSVAKVAAGMQTFLYGEGGTGGMVKLVEEQVTAIKTITEFNMAMVGVITLFAIGGPIAVGVGLLVAAIGNNAESIMNFVNNIDNMYFEFQRAVMKAALEIPQAIADFLYTTIMKVIFGDGSFAGFQVRMLRNPFTPGSDRDEDYLIKFGIGPQPRNNTDLPLFARQGGYLTGPSHSAGGIPIEAEGGEYIINKRSVSRIGLPFLNQLNRYDEGGAVEQTSSTANANLGSLGFNIRQLPFGDKAAQILGETFMRLGPFNFPFNMAGGGAKIFGRKIFADGGAIDPSGSTGVGAFGFRSPRIGSNLTGHVSASVGGSILPPRMGGSVDYDPPPILGGLGSIFGFEGGGPVPRMSYRSGGAVSSNDSELAMAINQLAGAIRSQGTTEVNVYTDLEGQTRAAVSEYRAEVRERQARSL